MKALALTLSLSLLLVAPLGCGKKNDDDKKNDKKGAVDSLTDYATGGAQIEAGQAAKRRIIATTIQNNVNLFRVQEEREPASLQDLVDAGYTTREGTLDEYGRPLQSESRDGKLVVRSVKPDGTVSWEKEF
jgi:hypothetical protein